MLRPSLRALALGALASGCVHARFDEARLFRPRPCAPAADTPAAGAPAPGEAPAGAVVVRDVPLYGSGGARLQGVLLQRPGARAVLLYLGGNESRHCADRLVRAPAGSLEAALLGAAGTTGASILLVNYRGYGGSAGRPAFASLRADALAVFDSLAAEPALRGLPVIVYGQSIGATFAMHVAAHRPVAGVVLESPPTTLREVVRGVTPWYLVPFLRVEMTPAVAAEDNVRAAGAVTAPLLVLVGDRDPVAPPRMARRVLAASGSTRRELQVVRGAGHGDLVRHAAFWRALRAFLAEVTAGAAQTTSSSRW